MPSACAALPGGSALGGTTGGPKDGILSFKLSFLPFHSPKSSEVMPCRAVLCSPWDRMIPSTFCHLSMLMVLPQVQWYRKMGHGLWSVVLYLTTLKNPGGILVGCSAGTLSSGGALIETVTSSCASTETVDAESAEPSSLAAHRSGAAAGQMRLTEEVETYGPVGSPPSTTGGGTGKLMYIVDTCPMGRRSLLDRLYLLPHLRTGTENWWPVSSWLVAVRVWLPEGVAGGCRLLPEGCPRRGT
mmetsp:Transcript_12222/g.34377  ORF Transcript_12222/g.34377 Transcript_12222/m.34377 type:complete len:243 (+) Transcript_12222:1058-1786(+)